MSQHVSQHAKLLNALDEMQHSHHYALRKVTLVQAEQLIVAQEQTIGEQTKCINELIETLEIVLRKYTKTVEHFGIPEKESSRWWEVKKANDCLKSAKAVQAWSKPK